MGYIWPGLIGVTQMGLSLEQQAGEKFHVKYAKSKPNPRSILGISSSSHCANSLSKTISHIKNIIHLNLS